MTSRMTRKTVTFARPFTLSGFDGPQPAGTYTVETEEELVEGMSFPVYRRVETVMLLPGAPGSMVLAQSLVINPDELAEAERQDAAAP